MECMITCTFSKIKFSQYGTLGIDLGFTGFEVYKQNIMLIYMHACNHTPTTSQLCTYMTKTNSQ